MSRNCMFYQNILVVMAMLIKNTYVENCIILFLMFRSSFMNCNLWGKSSYRQRVEIKYSSHVCIGLIDALTLVQVKYDRRVKWETTLIYRREYLRGIFASILGRLNIFGIGCMLLPMIHHRLEVHIEVSVLMQLS